MTPAHRYSPALAHHEAFNEDLRLYRFLVDSLTEHAVFVVSPDGIVLSWNSGAEHIFGYTRAETLGRVFDIFFTTHDVRAGAPRRELDSALSGGKTHHDRWHVRKDGTWFWGTNTVQPLYDSSGILLGFTKLVRDTTASHLSVEQLTDSEQRLRLLIESVRDYAIFSCKLDGTITSWSDEAVNILGYPRDEVLGRNFSLLFTAEDRHFGRPAAELDSAAIHAAIDIEWRLIRKDGSAFRASGKISQLKVNAAGDSRGFVILIHDTTEHHLATEDLRRRAQFDALTSLPNRQTFYDHVQRAIALVKRRSSHVFAVLFIDLDHFKAVNDTFGHVIADFVLVEIARRLKMVARSEDVVARIGGDEFAVLLNGIDSYLDAEDAAQRILARMREPVRSESGDVFAAVSVGIALGVATYDQAEDIVRDADAAMYVAKSQGRARAVVFDKSIDKAVRDNVDLTTGLRHAIERNELRMAYQPILRLADSSITGFEALVRWKHPRRGLLRPSDFIPQAEESHLVVAVDHWVLVQACKQLAHWRNRGLASPTLQMSVNVSSTEFSRSDFPNEIQNALIAAALPASSLRLEITEGKLLEQSARASETLTAVRALGVRVDVDDFGTGYASLGALNHIRVDGLKIDWSFVTSTNAVHGWDIIEAVIGLAHKLGLVAIAEGIETTEQLERLLALGCNFGQGHLFAPALGAVAAGAFLRDKSRLSC